MVPTTTPRKRRKEARPAELLAAAIEIFVEKGYAAARLEDVATRASVSKGTLYLYYANKEALFKAVIQESIIPVIAENEQIFAQHTGSSFTLLEILLDNWWAKIGQTSLAGIPKLIIAEAGNFPELAQFYHDHVISRGRQLVGAALQRGMVNGEFRQIDIDTAIDVIIAPVLMLLIWRHSLAGCQIHNSDPKDYLAIHLDLLKHGLRRPPPTDRV